MSFAPGQMAPNQGKKAIFRVFPLQVLKAGDARRINRDCSKKLGTFCKVSNWEIAFNNTKTIEVYNKYLGINSYKKSCKNCGSTFYKKGTQDRQLIGNCYQRIVICECNNTFVEEFNQ